jgi:hypothetical protein
MKARPVRILISVVGLTDRDGWEWGDGIATTLEALLNEDGNAAFGPVTVCCEDIEFPAVEPREESQ